MGIAESLLPEFDHEMATTRALLARVPEGMADWRPHEKSMSVGQLAMHIVTVTTWGTVTLQRTEFDTNPPEGQHPGPPIFASSAQLLEAYDAAVQAARPLLVSTTDAAFMVQWTLKSGGKSLFSMPRAVVFRSFVLSHAIHHRGQLTVYLRMLGVPLPSIYGPTADS